MTNSTHQRGKYALFYLFYTLLTFNQFSANSQGQNIGSFPDLEGGFEKYSPGLLPQVLQYNSGVHYNTWNTNSAVANNAIISFDNPRTGLKKLYWQSTDADKLLYSPSFNNSSLSPNTSYILQFYYSTSSDEPLPGAGTPVVHISSDGSVEAALGPNESTDMDYTDRPTNWVKKAVVINSSDMVTKGKYGMLEFACSNMGTNSLNIDDLVVYEGESVDNSAPGAVGNLQVPATSSETITLSWNMPAAGIDGGGFMVVRSNEVFNGNPNSNGIYGVGNQIGNAVVVYIGTGTSFVDRGLIEGQVYHYAVFSVDKAFNYSGSQKIFAIPVASDFATVFTAGITVSTDVSVYARAEVVADGGPSYPIIKRGITWGRYPNPSIDSNSVIEMGSEIGIYADSIAGLLPGTTYYAKAFATTAAGTSYGQEIVFTTYSLPHVSATTKVSRLSFSSVTTGVTVDSIGGLSTIRGVCYNKVGAPTIYDSVTVYGESKTRGNSVCRVEYLDANTTYYLRGFATNKIGTVYGPTITFKTLDVYYNVEGADLSKLSGWNTQPDGSGVAPTNFSADNFAYNIRNKDSYFGGDLVITGKNSRIVIGDGFHPASFTIPASHPYADMIDIRNLGVLNIQSFGMPKFNIIYEGSTVNLDGALPLVFPAKVQFYHLGSINDLGATRHLPLGNVNIAGVFTRGNAKYLVDTGNTVVFNGGSLQYIPAFEFQGLQTNNGRGCVADGSIIIRNKLTVGRGFTIPKNMTLQLADGSSMNIKSTLYIKGLLENNNVAELYNESAGGKISVYDSGTYKINGYQGEENFSARGFSFQKGSNLYVATGRISLPTSIAGNVIWDPRPAAGNFNTSGFSILRNTGGDNTTIGGNLYIKNTATGEISNGWNGAIGKRLIVNGNLVMDAGGYTINAAPEDCEPQTLLVKGDLQINGGKLQISTSNYSAGFVRVRKNLEHRAGTFGNNSTTSNGTIVFEGTKSQNFYTTGLSNAVPVNINNRKGVVLMSNLNLNATDSNSLVVEKGIFHLGTNTVSIKGGMNFIEDAGIDAHNADLIFSGTNTQHIMGNGLLDNRVGTLEVNNQKGVVTHLPLALGDLWLNNGMFWNAGQVVSVNSIKNFTPQRFVVLLSDTAVLKINRVDQQAGPVIFPIGPARRSYNPLTIYNKGIKDNYAVSITSNIDEQLFSVDSVGIVNLLYNVVEDVQGGSDIDLTIQWNKINEGSKFRSTSNGGQVYIAQKMPGYWLKTPTESKGSNPYYASVSGVRVMGSFGVGNVKAFINPLPQPPTIVTFTGRQKDNLIVLQWVAANEINMQGYEVERSTNGVNFVAFDTVASKAPASRNDYLSLDDNAPEGVIYYRLKMINSDDKFSYSQVITFVVKRPVSVLVYPNPAPVTGVLYVSHNHRQDEATITIQSLWGVKVAQFAVLPGTKTTRINVPSLAQGTYILKYTNKEGEQTVKFIKGDE